MCVVSFVSDHFGTDGPFKQPFQWPPAAPATLPWTPDAFAELKKIMEMVKRLDEKLGLPDCEDPKKAEWMKAVEDRLIILEGKKKRK